MCPELTKLGINLLTQNFAVMTYMPGIVVGAAVMRADSWAEDANTQILRIKSAKCCHRDSFMSS